jgi:hypothetical protein
VPSDVNTTGHAVPPELAAFGVAEALAVPGCFAAGFVIG